MKKKKGKDEEIEMDLGNVMMREYKIERKVKYLEDY